jgi:hypothetical protein
MVVQQGTVKQTWWLLDYCLGRTGAGGNASTPKRESDGWRDEGSQVTS